MAECYEKFHKNREGHNECGEVKELTHRERNPKSTVKGERPRKRQAWECERVGEDNAGGKGSQSEKSVMHRE